MRKKDNNPGNLYKTSRGGYVLLGIILIFVVSIIFIEQYRKYNERRALKYGLETVCEIVEINRQKTQFAKYKYVVEGKTLFSSKATPFDGIIPGETYKVKYLKDEPLINKILFDYPVIEDKTQTEIKGYIQKITNSNKADYLYNYNNVLYERRQLLREGHTFKRGDSVNILVKTANPKIGIMYY